MSTLGPDIVVLDADLDPNGADHGLVRDLKRLTAARWCSSATGSPAKR